MNKSNLSREDQQLEMVGNLIINFFKGVYFGIRKVLKEPSKMLIIVLVSLASGAIFYLRKEITVMLFPEATGFNVFKLVLLAAPVFPVITLYILGTEKEEGSDEFDQKFASIKFCAKNGEYPKLRNKEQREKDIVYTFFSPDITLQTWKDRELELENVLDLNILDIRTAKESKQIIRLRAVPAEQGIKDDLPWDDEFIREKDFVLCIGKGLLDFVEINLNKYPHALIAGVTGSGKSVILRAMLWQCIKKGARIYMIDFKGGVEFGTAYEQFGEVVTSRQRALELMKALTKEMRLRLDIFRKYGVKNIEEYNRMNPDNPLCRIILACDEVSEMLDKTGLQKKEQAIFYELEKEMSSLARLARAAGINMLLATQRPDAKVIPGQIKNNLPIRISGRMVDKHASEIILGNTKASQMDDTLGRFMYTVGADTYEFQAFNFKDSSLVYGDYQKGSMLTEQGYELEDNVVEEFDDEFEDDFDFDELEEMEGF
ncbi:MAG: FtsK/SpoIIIE domain-containing protein [Anaerovoracaceae bacterium]